MDEIKGSFELAFFKGVMGAKASIITTSILVLSLFFAFDKSFSQEAQETREQEDLQQRFDWWPTDARPSPVKDASRGGYWWWPKIPGKTRPWGNRGYIYVNKIIFDYKEEELPPAKSQELRPSLLVKKIVRNVKIYFDFDSAKLRMDAIEILEKAVSVLKKYPETDILVTGNCDRRGPEAYNLKLGRERALAVSQFMLDKGIEHSRVRIISRGKLDAVAPLSDLMGMQRDRNAQFMIAQVEEVMLPAPQISEEATKVEENKFVEEAKEEVASEVSVSTKEYVVKKGDSLWKIAERELGKGHRWKYIYELNKDRIKNPDKLKTGTKILIPVE